MTISHWQISTETPIREVDFLIIGAGVVGCSAAYFAAQAGRSVVITDTRDVALGASGRNAGFMISGLDTYYHRAIEQYGHAVTREVWQLSKRTHEHLRGFIQRGNLPIQPTGSLLLAESQEEAAELEAAARAMEADGLPIEYTAYDPLGRGYCAAIRQPDDAGVQPYLLVNSIFAQSNAELVPNNEVYAIEQHGDTVTVYSQKVTFKARTVLIATNGYSARLHPYFSDKVIPTRAQCLVTEPLPAPVIDVCGYSDYGYMYYRMTFDGRFLIGGGRKNNKPAENDTTDDRITDAVQGALEAYMHQWFPDVTAPVSRRWSGVMGFSVDGLPLTGTMPNMPNVGYAVGFTGHGMALGAGTAERIVDHLLHGASLGAVDGARLG
jgi:glycine/D-amino acid oxidase-like deaminating enzyme